MKRKSIKGKGADIFLASEQNGVMTEEQKDSIRVELTKVTFYLPVDLVDELDVIYLDSRKAHRDKKITKSLIVKIALDELFADFKENHNDSTLAKHLTGKE